jgi:hypothetical protein
MEIFAGCPPHEDRFVVALFFDRKQWGELYIKEEQKFLKLYSHPTGKPWVFGLKEFSEALKKAEAKL